MRARRLLRPADIALAALVLFGIGCLAQAGWSRVKAQLAQWLIASAWDRVRDGEADARPWPWADTSPVARLSLPQDAGTLFVLAGASGRNLAFGPAHDPASVLPGERGNSVIAGHRDTHFAALRGLAEGDRFTIERADGRVFEFEVIERRIVDSRHTRIALESDVPRVTLVTCYPFDAVARGGPLRYVVVAHLTAAHLPHRPRHRRLHARPREVGGGQYALKPVSARPTASWWMVSVPS